jgi:hypothetical protein
VLLAEKQLALVWVKEMRTMAAGEEKETRTRGDITLF